MVQMTSLRAARARVRSFSIFVCAALLLMSSISCRGNSSGSGCILFGQGEVVTFDFAETDGFDDQDSTGAALGVAIDTGTPNQGLIIALRFSPFTTERAYSPTCDTELAIAEYGFSQLNSVTFDIADSYAFLTDGLTDTEGIETMGHSMNALFFIDDVIEGLRVFLAVDGRIIMRRSLGDNSSPRVTGDLVFVEITEAGPLAEILPGGDVIRIENIDMQWDTAEQPVPL